MLEGRVLAIVRQGQARLRRADLMWAFTAGAAACAGIRVLISLTAIPASWGMMTAVIGAVVVSVFLAISGWRRWTLAAAAMRIE